MQLSGYDKIQIAQKPSTSQETLAILACDDDPDVRYFVAKDPNTPQDVLLRLSTDNDWMVRYCIMRNSNATEDIIMLAKATDFIVNEMWKS
jgi:hypothetical protein